MTIRHRPVPRFPLALALVAAMGFAATLVAQDRLKSMPGYDQYQKMVKEVTGAVKPGALSVTWKDAKDLRVREGRQDVPVRRDDEGCHRDGTGAGAAGARRAGAGAAACPWSNGAGRRRPRRPPTAS